MNKKEIKRLKELAVKVLDAHEDIKGLCGLHPYNDEHYDLKPHVQLSYKAFMETFDDYETSENGREVFVFVDGVKFFALEESVQVNLDD